MTDDREVISVEGIVPLSVLSGDLYVCISSGIVRKYFYRIAAQFVIYRLMYTQSTPSWTKSCLMAFKSHGDNHRNKEY